LTIFVVFVDTKSKAVPWSHGK